jgi:hypothetical protein
MLFRISIFILCFVCFSCSPEPYKVTLAKMVRNQYSKQMLYEECLQTVGTGGGMMNEIETFFNLASFSNKWSKINYSL